MPGALLRWMSLLSCMQCLFLDMVGSPPTLRTQLEQHRCRTSVLMVAEGGDPKEPSEDGHVSICLPENEAV